MKKDMTNAQTYKVAAVLAYGPTVGAFIWDTWTKNNFELWEGLMEPGPITIGLHSLTSLYFPGLFIPAFNEIHLNRGLLFHVPGNRYRLGESEIIHANFERVADVILHEQLHQYLYQRHGTRAGASHNDDYWKKEVERISKIRDIDCDAWTMPVVDHGNWPLRSKTYPKGEKYWFMSSADDQ